MLNLSSLTSGYDGGTVLHGLDLEIPDGSVHAVVGHNGAGKTTLIHTVAGLVPTSSGRVSVAGSDVTRLPAHRRARAGVGLVPQGRRVFPGLTVQEHLTLAAGGRRRRAGAQWTPDSVKELLPRLAERAGHRGRQLSGGEQQMLAIARALLGQPRLLLLDEPTEGLAPLIVQDIADLIKTLPERGLTILVAAPRPAFAVEVAERVTILVAGRVAEEFSAKELRDQPELAAEAMGHATAEGELVASAVSSNNSPALDAG
ncbi:ABC transporter ATP-binding protein [Catenulispora sp. NF23]|uniref:ABC transporter ATP-binding protein n=1 Tax=Catenulispora pinistramenti TaxID=2705254 RepID=A0ABS5L542_9ACTN|nr:ABC transporter ATP-binding protein [Catenulispora pinistramenti]MBS2539703.1 ABC transporter ATP-binding protein [Catenulispora pinistramenti]MBS2553456.1 ABC transporter ATP-binding protein [Catenulispora pinistramenti]